MITRREKLLIKPWEQKRYENHLRKVRSAGPAIDVGPPAHRHHVLCKLKKQQKENERCDKIERDNFILLQRLRKIMTTSRVDNYWTTAQPSFLNRVELYGTKPKPIQYKSSSVTPDVEDKTRKGRCHACTPKKIKGPTIPEERIPWEPPKEQIGKRRSRSLPPRMNTKTKSVPLITEEKSKISISDLIDKSIEISEHSENADDKLIENVTDKHSGNKSSDNLTKSSEKSKSAPVRTKRSNKNLLNSNVINNKNLINKNVNRNVGGDKSSRPNSKKLSASSSSIQSIVFSRDDIYLAVNFPSDTLVKLKDGRTERYLIRNNCQCKAINAH